MGKTGAPYSTESARNRPSQPMSCGAQRTLTWYDCLAHMLSVWLAVNASTTCGKTSAITARLQSSGNQTVTYMRPGVVVHDRQ